MAFKPNYNQQRADRNRAKAQKRDADFKLEQEREYEAMVSKTARLRELRLAKEAEERRTATPATRAPRHARPRRSKQT